MNDLQFSNRQHTDRRVYVDSSVLKMHQSQEKVSDDRIVEVLELKKIKNEIRIGPEVNIENVDNIEIETHTSFTCFTCKQKVETRLF